MHPALNSYLLQPADQCRRAILGRGELTPRRLRIYANRTNIVDFSEAEDSSPQLNISLLEGETGVTEYPLRTASFANIHSLSLFFVRLRPGPHFHALDPSAD